jgi:hypothetical protein
VWSDNIARRSDASQIRCSGFDQSDDGRCTNCQRFSQECVFTPVSAQTHAFVPAHTVWRGQNPPPNTQLYGAYGQPLPAGGQQPAAPYPPQQPGQYPPPPQGYQQQPPMYPQQANMQQPPQGQQPGQKRPNDEPHTPTLPPPNPAEQAQGQRQPFYGDPTLNPAGASPASSSASFHSAQPQPYFAAHPPASRSSPQSAYSYDPSRASSSPHTVGQPGTPAPPTSGGVYHTPPPGVYSASVVHSGVAVNEVGSHAGSHQQQQHKSAAQASMKQEERTSTDTNMVHALNRGTI